MSVCVPSFSSIPPLLAAPPRPPSTPPPGMSSAPLSPLRGSSERDTFAGRLSKALESVLPLHSTPPRQRQRRASLPALFHSPVCSTARARLGEPRMAQEREGALEP